MLFKKKKEKEEYKGYPLHLSYPQEFTELMQMFKEKYGEEIFKLDGIGEDQLDLNSFAKTFFDNGTVTADVSVDANANVDSKDVIAYTFEAYKAPTRLNNYYLLWKMLKETYSAEYAASVIEDQLTGAIYVNDFSGDFGKPYCFNYSTFDIALEGLPMVQKIKSIPPKYLSAFKSQLEQFVVQAANSTLGATGFADLFIVMGYYVDKALETLSDDHFYFAGESDVWAYARSMIASLIYTVNQPMRGNQSPFTNVSVMDRYFLEELVPSYTFPDGRTPKVETVLQLQRVFMACMNEELQRTPITFPVTTACLSVDEDNNIQDDEFLTDVATYNMDYGFINMYHGKTSTLSSCCRLRSDTSNEYFNSFGAGSTKIGSLGVVTLNLPQLATQAVNLNEDEADEAFLKMLKPLVEEAANINNEKREFIKKRISYGAMPLYDLGFMDLNKQYSTCGVNGLNEALEILGYDITKWYGQQYSLKVIEVINNVNDEMQKLFSAPHNCEQTPSETSAIKLAQKDELMGYNDFHYPLYSNQFIPLTTRVNMLKRIEVQGMLDKHFSGGAICHLTTGERLTSELTMKQLIRHVAKKGVIYWAVNFTLAMCEKGHMTVGKSKVCSVCGAPITNFFTRVVGFLTNTKNWHEVRRTEDFPNRQHYRENGVNECIRSGV